MCLLWGGHGRPKWSAEDRDEISARNPEIFACPNVNDHSTAAYVLGSASLPLVRPEPRPLVVANDASLIAHRSHSPESSCLFKNKLAASPLVCSPTCDG